MIAITDKLKAVTWFNLTPLASLLCAKWPNWDMTSLSSLRVAVVSFEYGTHGLKNSPPSAQAAYLRLSCDDTYTCLIEQLDSGYDNDDDSGGAEAITSTSTVADHIMLFSNKLYPTAADPADKSTANSTYLMPLVQIIFQCPSKV
ncbi:uncharacterized protein PV09_00649 [Verruconis gallopava]|uniref:Uncharacterized protein n=1 Tax=Verruconis gallopava TaxID=253628 RepID=A0A0D1Z6W3_9PEZI|nr:uncharacterized protein PV09_00649 [Verruconis gallopava]KIW08702.1 hypothetical protein PV09_00649 [Verruconis gallopava]